MRLLLVVNVDTGLLSHRLPVAIGALNAGYEVHVAMAVTEHSDYLNELGLIVHPIKLNRSSMNPFGFLALFFQYIRLFWMLRPDILHLVTIKPVLIGGLAARLSPVKGVVFAISGLGHIFVADGYFSTLKRSFVLFLYGIVLKFSNYKIIIQNKTDRSLIEGVFPPVADHVIMIPGSGVDLMAYKPTPLPFGTPIILFVGRLLLTKGIVEFVEASNLLKMDGVDVVCRVAGATDEGNPACISHDLINEWKACHNIDFIGHVDNIADEISKSYLVVLPSYREGLPKALIEAAACGRAIVTTNAPGCRDAIESEVTGLLVPVKDSHSLAKAIKRLVFDRRLCENFGRFGRLRAEKYFDINSVVRNHLDAYSKLIKNF